LRGGGCPLTCGGDEDVRQVQREAGGDVERGLGFRCLIPCAEARAVAQVVPLGLAGVEREDRVRRRVVAENDLVRVGVEEAERRQRQRQLQASPSELLVSPTQRALSRHPASS
jgi:hypothetical protein